MLTSISSGFMRLKVQKISTLILMMFAGMGLLKAQEDVENQWVKRLGSTGWDQCSRLAVDPMGNVLVMGTFQGQVDFDPGPNTFNLISAGELDVFFAKYDSSGNFLWAKKIGGSGMDLASDIKIDHEGNIYLIGYYSGTVDFDPGIGVANRTSAGGMDVFLSKFYMNGEYLWSKSFGGSGPDMGVKMALNSSGDIYFTGFFSGSAIFNFGSNSITLMASGSMQDVFIAKCGTGGFSGWAKKIGGAGEDQGRGITLDIHENIYVTGVFTDMVDFDPSLSNTATMTSNNYSLDVFFAKYDKLGNYTWAKSLGSSGLDYGYDIHLDKNSDLFLTGYFSRSIDFDPDTSVFILTADKDYSAYLAKYDTMGSFYWAKNFRGPNNNGASLTSDLNGNLYLTGSFTDSIRMNPDTLVNFIQAVGLNDIFFCKYDSLGDFVWAKTIGGTGRDEGRHIAIDEQGRLYVVGDFQGSVNFQAPGGNGILNSGGQTDGFIARYQKISTVGLNEINATIPLVMHIYPNPANDFFQLMVEGETKGTMSVYIRTLTGQLVHASILAENENQLKMNVKTWPKGVYILSISDSTRLIHKRLVIH